VNPADITLGLAFVAGLVSFISPCVLPLVPAYIGYMGGRVTNTVAAQVAGNGGGLNEESSTLYSRFSTALHGLFFVSGFTFVFVAFGLLSTAFVQQIGGQNISLVTNIIGRVGGIIIIFFGLHFMGVLPSVFTWLRDRNQALDKVATSTVITLIFSMVIIWSFGNLTPLYTRIPTNNDELFGPTLAIVGLSVEWFIALPVLTALLLWLVLGGAFTTPGTFWLRTINTLERWLYTDTRRQMIATGHQSYSGSAIMGVVFSAGWTPCIGPIFGSILTLAANTGDVGRAGPLLAAYSFGLGVPFLLTALLLDSAQGILRHLHRYMRRIELVSGAFLVFIGLAVASGQLQSLSSTFATGTFLQAATDLENSVIGSLTGESSDTAEDTSDTGITFLETGTINNDTDSSITLPGESTIAPLGSVEEAAESIEGPIVGTDVGDLAPDFETVSDTGETLSLSDYRGQGVLLNFWATWCGPCRLEMPEFQTTYESFSNDGYTVLAVNNREILDDVTGFREEFALTFPMALDEQGVIQERYGIISYPSTYVLDRDGVIIARQYGPLTRDQIQQLVTQALNT
jgi:cytochrome c biogenesis protein CcdA/peroxiredoxin